MKQRVIIILILGLLLPLSAGAALIQHLDASVKSSIEPADPILD